MRFSSLSLVVVLALLAAVANGQPPPVDNKMKKSAQVVDGKTMYDWMKELKESKDPGVKVRAIAALKFYGLEARTAVPLIMKALTDPDISLRVNAAIALGFIGFDAKDRENGINALAGLLTYPETQGIVKFQAARALGRLGPDSAPALPKLLNAITDRSSSEIRGAAAFALGSAGWDSSNGPNRHAIQALLKALNDVCHDVRMEAIFSLIVLGPPLQGTDKAAEDRALQALIHDRSKAVAIWSRVAIMRLNKVLPQHLAAVAKFLKDPDLDARVNAARAFAIMGKDAKDRVKDLSYALEDKEPKVLIWVCVALGEMRDAAQDALPKLKDLAEHQDDPRVKQAAAEAIGKITEKVKK